MSQIKFADANVVRSHFSLPGLAEGARISARAGGHLEYCRATLFRDSAVLKLTAYTAGEPPSGSYQYEIGEVSGYQATSTQVKSLISHLQGASPGTLVSGVM